MTKPPKQKIVRAWKMTDEALALWQADIRPWLQEQYPDDPGIEITNEAMHHAFRVMRDLRQRVEA